MVSLILLSSHFSEAESGPLHTIQRGVSAVFAPVGEVATRALKPVRDLINWFDETFDARGENERAARPRSPKLRAAAGGRRAGARARTSSSASCSELDRADPGLGDYDLVTGRVIGRSPTVWFST